MQADFLSSGSYTANVAGLSAGTTSTISTANIIHYFINSDGKTKAAVTNQATPTTDIVTGLAFVAVTPTASVGKACAYTLGLDASGNIVAAQGNIVDWDGATTAPSYGFGNQVPKAPNLSATYAPFGVILVRNAAGSSAFTFGTTSFAQSGLSNVFHSVGFIPARPFLT
jgi:hypothetical protein